MDAAGFYAWLRSSSISPVVLIEATACVGGVDKVVRMSSREFVTWPTDNPGNEPYFSVVSGGVSVSESLPLDLSGSGMSWGDIRIINESGALDPWLSWVWANRPISVLIGDISWPLNEFWPVFVGVVEDIGSPARGELALKLRDSLQRLNSPVSEAKLGGSTDNKDRLLPLSFGHVFNVAPLLVSPNLHEYMVHNGPVSSIVEVRDQGLPVSATINSAAGTFKLNQRPFGQVTADVVAQVQAPGNVAELIRLLATSYGKSSERFLPGEIDDVSFAQAGARCPQPVGLHLSDRDNVLSVCQRLAASVGCMLSVSRAGKLRLVRLAAPQAGGRRIGPPDILLSSDQLAERPAVAAGVKLGYAKNWCQQGGGLAGGVPEAHRQFYADEWQVSAQSDAQVAELYRLHTEAAQMDTLLVRRADADVECQRRLSLCRVARHVVRVTGRAHLLDITVGDSVVLELPRWGMNVGAAGLVVGAKPNWLERHIELDVLVWAQGVADIPPASAGAGYQHESIKALQAAAQRVIPIALPANITVSGGQVSGALSASTTIGGSQIVGGINAGVLYGQISTSLLSADVVKASTINSYSLSANQITSGQISTSLLSADVVKTNTLQASIASLSGGIVTSGVQITGSYGLMTQGGVYQIGSGFNNNFNGQAVFNSTVSFMGDVLFSGFRRPVLGGVNYSCVINGVASTISIVGGI